MSESNELNVNVPVVQEVIKQLGALTASLDNLTSAMQDDSNLDWTGDDKEGRTLNEQLAPAEQSGVQAVTDTKGAVDGLVNSLGTTAGLWKKTEDTNVEMNR
jgi:hypothetical protein